MMCRRKLSYLVSGGKTRSVLKYHWWTNRPITDGFSTFLQTHNQRIALRMFRRLKVKWRQIDIRFHNGKQQPRVWLYLKMTAKNNRIKR